VAGGEGGGAEEGLVGSLVGVLDDEDLGATVWIEGSGSAWQRQTRLGWSQMEQCWQ